MTARRGQVWRGLPRRTPTVLAAAHYRRRRLRAAGGPCAASPAKLDHRRAVLAVLLLLIGSPAPLRAETANRIVAVVNDDVVTQADVAAFMSAVLEEGESSPSGEEAASIRQAALQRLIEQRLILQHAKRSGITVEPEETGARLDQIRSQFETDDALERSLAESGLSEERLKAQLSDQLMVQKAIDADVRSAIVVSPQEVARALSAHPELAKAGDRVRGSHLLIRVNDARPLDAARRLAQQLQQQLARGASFAELARRYSEGPHAEDGGDLGWVAQGELMPELEAALFSLQTGQVSDPIETKLGIHLVKVEERRTASSLSVTEAHRAVHQQLYQQKFQAAFTKWLDGLKGKAYIEILEPEGR